MIEFIKKIITSIRNWFEKRNKKQFKKSAPVGVGRKNNITVIDLNGDKETNVLDVDLVDDNATEESKKKVKQYTKKYITAITVMACIWISTSYILSAIALINYGNVDVLMQLSIEVCHVILGACVAYHLKAYFETATEKGMELVEKRWTNQDTDNISENINKPIETDGESVG